MSDIARAAGVSRSTACRAMGGFRYVKADVRERVLRIASEMNYAPNLLARSLVLGRSQFVGLMGSLLPTVDSVISIAQSALMEDGFSLVFYLAPEEEDKLDAIIGRVVQDGVAGVLCVPHPGHPGAAEQYQSLVNSGIKVVVVDRAIDGLQVPHVVGDSYDVGRLPTEYLISLGHHDIVCLAMPVTSTMGRDRVRGFRDAMDAAGIPVSKHSIVETGFGETQGMEAMKQLLARKKLPTAVVARHDCVAMGAMRAIYAHGLSIPRDISIVGNGDSPGLDLLAAPLTTVRQPLGCMVETAANTLLDMLNGKDIKPESIKLPVELVVRGSCAPPQSF
ncbi:MAG: LacI family DNA-binding transcriptional regulator [Armatimonadota bacterium]